MESDNECASIHPNNEFEPCPRGLCWLCCNALKGNMELGRATRGSHSELAASRGSALWAAPPGAGRWTFVKRVVMGTRIGKAWLCRAVSSL